MWVENCLARDWFNQAVVFYEFIWISWLNYNSLIQFFPLEFWCYKIHLHRKYLVSLRRHLVDKNGNINFLSSKNQLFFFLQKKKKMREREGEIRQGSDMTKYLDMKTEIIESKNWNKRIFVVVQSLSCLTLCDPMDCSIPRFPVLHQLPEFAQTHVHWINDAIQPSHPLLPASPPALNLSQHQALFQWISSSHQVAKVLELQL